MEGAGVGAGIPGRREGGLVVGRDGVGGGVVVAAGGAGGGLGFAGLFELVVHVEGLAVAVALAAVLAAAGRRRGAAVRLGCALVDVFVQERLGEAEEDGEEAVQALDGGAVVGELGEVVGHGFHEGEVGAVGGRDDVAEEDEEGSQGVEEERPGHGRGLC